MSVYHQNLETLVKLFRNSDSSIGILIRNSILLLGSINTLYIFLIVVMSINKFSYLHLFLDDEELEKYEFCRKFKFKISLSFTLLLHIITFVATSWFSIFSLFIWETFFLIFNINVIYTKPWNVLSPHINIAIAAICIRMVSNLPASPCGFFNIVEQQSEHVLVL